MRNSFIDASKQLHQDNPGYGASQEYTDPRSMKHALTIPAAIKAAQNYISIKSILDHGTGQGGLVEVLNADKQLMLDVRGYDPGVSKFSEKPTSPFDIVTSVDVLEHIGREYIESTLIEINELTRKFFFFCIDLIPASKRVKDGRNAHFLIAPSDWWMQQIKSKFKIVTCIETGMAGDGSNYPMHLFGCGTNSMKHFSAMNNFLENVEIANKKWVWKDSILALRNY